MSERYYIVSSKELHQLVEAAKAHAGVNPEHADEYLKTVNNYLKTQAACRARSVPEWATHFAGPPKDWTNYSVDDETVPVTLLEEIKR